MCLAIARAPWVTRGVKECLRLRRCKNTSTTAHDELQLLMVEMQALDMSLEAKAEHQHQLAACEP